MSWQAVFENPLDPEDANVRVSDAELRSIARRYAFTVSELRALVGNITYGELATVRDAHETWIERHALDPRSPLSHGHFRDLLKAFFVRVRRRGVI